MTVAQANMHTLVLSTKQVEELSDLVASGLQEIVEDIKTCSPAEKPLYLIHQVFYQGLYGVLDKALQDT